MGRHKDLHGEDIHVPDQNHISKLRLEFISVNEIRVLEGECASSDSDFEMMKVDLPLTLDIETSGINGLDTGSEAASTWCFVFIIKNLETGQVAGLLSASSESPTLPEGFTKKRRIGSVLNDLSSNFVPFDQHDFGNLRKYSYHYSFAMISEGVDTDYMTFSCAAVVPPVAEMVKLGYYLEWNSAGQDIVTGWLKRTGVSGDQYIIRGFHRHEIIFSAMCDTSQQFDYKVDADCKAWVKIYGWEERI